MAQPENSVPQPSITYCHYFGNAEDSSSKNVKKKHLAMPLRPQQRTSFLFYG